MTDSEDKNTEKPPFFRSWKGLYIFVIAVEAFLILLFYLFTNMY